MLRPDDEAPDTPNARLPADWQQKCLQPDFDDSAWEEVTGAVSQSPPRKATGSPTRLYLRRTFTIDNPNYTQLRLRFLGARGQVAEVYLNGTLVAELAEGPRKGYGTVTLKPEANALLRRGANCLAVYCYSDEGKSLSVDVGLEATDY